MAFSLLASTYVGPGAVSSHMLFVLTFGVCVEIGKQNNILGERREKRTRERENYPSNLCRLWAPPKSEKVEY